jgi:hypothetical protein
METNELLAERGKTHGDFSTNALVSQKLKLIVSTYHKIDPHNEFDHVVAEALDMICLKMSRILSGQAQHRDHWDDIAGYAKLAADHCESTHIKITGNIFHPVGVKT